jgi:hypothetical protein
MKSHEVYFTKKFEDRIRPLLKEEVDLDGKLLRQMELQGLISFQRYFLE